MMRFVSLALHWMQSVQSPWLRCGHTAGMRGTARHCGHLTSGRGQVGPCVGGPAKWAGKNDKQTLPGSRSFPGHGTRPRKVLLCSPAQVTAWPRWCSLQGLREWPCCCFPTLWETARRPRGMQSTCVVGQVAPPSALPRLGNVTAGQVSFAGPRYMALRFLLPRFGAVPEPKACFSHACLGQVASFALPLLGSLQQSRCPSQGLGIWPCSFFPTLWGSS